MGTGLRRIKSGALLGVDVGTDRVKLLELEGRPHALRIKSYAAEPLPAHCLADNHLADVDAVGTTVARALEKSGTRNRQAAIALPGTAVISKTITLPAELSAADIEQEILLEAPRHIPYPIDEVSLDFQVVDTDPDDSNRNRVLLVACRRDDIAVRTAILEAASLKPCLVDVEEYVLCNACLLLQKRISDAGRDGTIALFEMGAQRTQLNILHKRRLVFSRDVAYGGQSLAHELIARFGLTGHRQLSAWLHGKTTDRDEYADLLDSFCQRVGREMESALQFYFSTAANSEAIDQILVTGGCTLYPGFTTGLQKHLVWPLQAANPLEDLPASKAAARNGVAADGPTLMVAAGLSIRSML